MYAMQANIHVWHRRTGLESDRQELWSYSLLRDLRKEIERIWVSLIETLKLELSFATGLATQSIRRIEAKIAIIYQEYWYSILIKFKYWEIETPNHYKAG